MTSISTSTNGQTLDHTRRDPIGDAEDEWDTHSTTKSYYRMRADEAWKYVEDLRRNNSKKQLEKLKDDEDRIMKNRARLSRNTSTKKLQVDLKIAFQEWCAEVNDRGKGKKMGHSCAEREKLVKPDICSGPSQVPMGEDDDDPAHDMKAYFIYFEKAGKTWKGKTHRADGFPKYEKFPDQRISIHDALNKSTHNPFKPTYDDNGNPHLRYIHIPANHTGWIEQAMARYHDEHEQLPEEREKTNRTLSREFWKGQLHGGGLGRKPIHATHMRSRCSVIPGDVQSLFGEQKESSRNPESQGGMQERTFPRKDLAIFMPYLHWEMSGRRARMSQAVHDILKEEETKHKSSDGPAGLRVKRSATIEQDIEKYKKLFPMKDHENHEMAKKMMKKSLKPSKLGLYLLRLAQLWDAMDMELDERMVKCGLTSENTKSNVREPLLHIRRTLDQSYFLNLKDTSQRDQDQVVYRATKGTGNHTRVVMVDQLWLWVLDEHTIITSFPKRWGRNKPDSSGIHKSLRERLDRPDCKIMSAWHLASIIIDQCSNVFFDRTKPLDLRPEVMDIFAEALGNVNHYTTIAFKVFWHSVELFTQNRGDRGSNRQNQRYLDINPEGMLLREAQDIAEELKIMTGIFSQQLGVVKNFQKCLEHMNGDPKTRSKPHHFTKALQHFSDWAKEQSSSSQLKKEKSISLAEMEFLEDLVEEVENRKSEIMDLESAALQTCRQLQDLLSLKQQQASIVEAKAALDRADQSVAQAEESIQQGKAIMAFTIMTIIFTPLGFFTSFFGMNHSLTGAPWMTLGHQCLFMFLLSFSIIVIALSLAFKGSQVRQFLRPLRDPKTGFKTLKAWCHYKESKPGEKKIGKGDEGRPNETNGAKGYYHALGNLRGARLRKLAKGKNQAPSDPENLYPSQSATWSGPKRQIDEHQWGS